MTRAVTAPARVALAIRSRDFDMAVCCNGTSPFLVQQHVMGKQSGKLGSLTSLSSMVTT